MERRGTGTKREDSGREWRERDAGCRRGEGMVVVCAGVAP